MVSEDSSSAAHGAVIQLERVSRWYGPVIGLNDVSLTLHEGVTGLLGPNGAGKSTLIKLVTGQLRPNQGSVAVFGESVFANPRVMSRLGVSPEHEELYEHRSGRDHLEFLLQIGGYGRREAKSVAASSLDRVGLSAHADRRVGGYSKGMRQRLRIAQATMHRPQLVVLDEPLTGLDPVGRKEMIDYVRELAEEGVSVVLSGHVLHEVQRMTRRIVLIHHGRVLAEGTLQEIRHALDRRPHHVQVGTSQPHRIAQQLLNVTGVVSIRLAADSVHFETTQPDEFFERLMQLTAQAEWDIQQYEATDDNLQAIFDYLVA